MQPGFITLMGMSFAVNYNTEYVQIGLNEKLTDTYEASGGKVLLSDASVIYEELKAATNSEEFEIYT
jgi:hypothetical protein